MNTEINLDAITYELVETYNRLLHNDVRIIADAYRSRATKDFKGTISLLVLTGRIEDDEKALRYIDILEDRFDNCRESFEEYNSEILIDYEKIGDECKCDDSGICARESCPLYWKCRH